MQRLKDIEDSADPDGDALNEEKKIPPTRYAPLTAGSDHYHERLPVLNSPSASQQPVSGVSARSTPAASLRLHQRSETQISQISQASQHSKKSQ